MAPAKKTARLTKTRNLPADDPTPPAPPVTLPPNLTSPETIATYKTLYELLGQVYWEASDLNAKDTIQAARDTLYEILTDLNTAKLEANTVLFLSLKNKIYKSNEALEQIRDRIKTITKNISTASSVIAAIAKVLSIAPMMF